MCGGVKSRVDATQGAVVPAVGAGTAVAVSCAGFSMTSFGSQAVSAAVSAGATEVFYLFRGLPTTRMSMHALTAASTFASKIGPAFLAVSAGIVVCCVATPVGASHGVVMLVCEYASLSFRQRAALTALTFMGSNRLPSSWSELLWSILDGAEAQLKFVPTNVENITTAQFDGKMIPEPLLAAPQAMAHHQPVSEFLRITWNGKGDDNDEPEPFPEPFSGEEVAQNFLPK